MNINLKEKYELQSIFDLSNVLNSSLNLKTILNTLLLTLMGKFLISKGVVLICQKKNEFIIETLKGLPHSLHGKIIQIDDFPSHPAATREILPSVTQALLLKNDIEIILPVRHDGRELGFVGLGKKGLGDEFTDSELDYLNSLVNISATAIQNGLIFRQLENEKRKTDKRIQELNTLSEIVRELNSTLSTLETKKVVNLLAYSIMGEMVVNRCLIFLAGDDEMNLCLNKGVPAEQCELITGNKLVLEGLMQVPAAILVTDYKNGSVRDILTESGLVVLIPMIVENETKGVVALGEKITKMPFADDELNFLSILSDWSIISIETARLIEQELEKKALEEELRIASDIQRQLLPDTCPRLKNFEIAAVNYPSRQVGGDYYDCFSISDDEYVFCIADVSGKGPPAALLMANLQASLHALIGADMSLPEITGRINNIIYKNTSYDKFITFFVGILNLKDNTFTSVNGGHNPPYLFHHNLDFDTFNVGGLILGMMPDVEYSSESVTLVAGDCLVMFTDGVSEAMNKMEEEYAEPRIEKFIVNNFQLSANDMLRNLIDDVRNFSSGCPQADDITAMILKVS